MGGWLYDDVPYGAVHFLLLVVILGGAGAMATGRAIARTWRPYAIVPIAMVPLAAALRFLNYALFGGELLSVPGYLVALAVTVAASAYGYRSQRTRQMATQYSWLYAKTGPLGWTAKPS